MSRTKFEPPQDAVDKYFAQLGYTMPGSAMNVETAKGIARGLILTARHDAKGEIRKGLCGRCQAKLEREEGGIF